MKATNYKPKKFYRGEMSLADSISKVVVTEQFTDEYMDIFKKHVKSAQLFQEVDGKKVRVHKTPLTEKKDKILYVVETSMKVFGKPIQRKILIEQPRIEIPSIKLKKNERVSTFYIVRNHKEYFRRLAA